ncbi:MAG: glycosyltransferase family A protein [Pseudomonadota bacterium]
MADAPLTPFTIVVTSCGRFDLLERTMRSLYAHLDEAPARTIIVEDSGDDAVSDALSDVGAPHEIEFLINRPQLGQMAAIDRAYAMVRTPFIFHCEDDWEFFRTGFIGESRAVLDHHGDVSLVSLRARDALNPLLRDLPDQSDAGLQYFLADPARHPEYFSYTFNPGLRRLADALQIGPFAALGYEPDVSYAFKKAGFREAHLSDPAVRHIGDERHVDDPFAPKRPRSALGRLKRSASKRMKRLARLLK